MRLVILALGRVLLIGMYRAVAACGIAAAMFLTACYTYPSRPLAEVRPAAVVSARINDVGRVALSEPVGSGVDRIDGQVLENNDTAVSVMVSEVRFTNGQATKWQGQALTLRPQYVSSVSQRTYSRQRTLAAVLIGVALTAAALAASFTGIFNGGSGSDKPIEPPPVS